MGNNYIKVFCTIDTRENANMLANKLVKDKLAACINIIPEVSSVYFWQGKVHQDNECLLIIKTTAKLYKELEKRIKELHNYENPEIISLKIEDGAENYLRWIDENTQKNSGN